ncbi:ArdC-like ssDNA-binding domain-containing protein [Desulfobacter sp.]|uniref:ArdC-like ssDNA-binding domain-containing protein n=1 Tax=Desulfobacter sp. TaxID=2294 RepID=UPI003D105858
MSRYQDQLNDFSKRVLEAIEKGDAPWQKPWKEGRLLELPKNFTTGRNYKGVNLINLAMSGYNDPRWMTFNQAKEMDCFVRKGQKASTGFFYSPTRLEKELDDKGKPVLDENGQEKTTEVTKPVFKTFSVFNATQIEGIEPYMHPEPAWRPEDKAEKIIASANVEITGSQLDKAFYNFLTHAIETPDKSQFDDKSQYYSTIFHELSHATAHKSMMDRGVDYADKDSRAKEELRAEISSWLVCSQIGIGYSAESKESNKAYVSSWLKAIKAEDRVKELGFAMKDAEKIAEYLMGLDLDQKLSPAAPSYEIKAQIVENGKEIDNTPDFIKEKKFKSLDEAKSTAFAYHLAVISIDKENNEFFNDLPEETVFTVRDANGLQVYSTEAETETVQDVETEHDPPPKELAPKLYIHVPFKEKDEAKALGAKWDKQEKSWFVEPGADQAPFKKWLEPARENGLDMNEITAQFRDQAARRGLKIDTPQADGKLHRVAVEGDKAGKKSGAYTLYPDGRPAGFIQNHKTGEKANFKYEGEIGKTVVASGNKQARAAERDEDHAAAAKKAFGIYINAEKTSDHPYLTDKKINGDKEYRVDRNNRLIIPARNLKTNKIESLQFISEDGQKQFLTGGKKSGNAYTIGELDEQKPILLVEGFATGKTLNDVSHLPAVVCFDANNLENVAKQIRELMPSAELFICADNDHAKKNNVGVEKAQKAAKAVGAKVIIPKFTDDSKRLGYTDFNDLAKCKMGKSRVQSQLKSQIQYLSKNKGIGLER